MLRLSWAVTTYQFEGGKYVYFIYHIIINIEYLILPEQLLYFLTIHNLFMDNIYLHFIVCYYKFVIEYSNIKVKINVGFLKSLESQPEGLQIGYSCNAISILCVVL